MATQTRYDSIYIDKWQRRLDMTKYTSTSGNTDLIWLDIHRQVYFSGVAKNEIIILYLGKYSLVLSIRRTTLLLFLLLLIPRGLTFSWWGCYGLCPRNKPTELANSSYSVLVSVLFMALSTVFHSINSPDNSPLYHFALLVLILPYWFFQLYISLCKSPQAVI